MGMRRTLALAAAALALFLASCHRPSQPPARTRAVTVTFLDVGQADCALIRTPEGESVLVDAGHNGGTAPLLAAYGVRSLDLVVLTHAHADHTGGLKAVAKQCRIGRIWISGLDDRRGFREKLERVAPVEPVFAGKQLRLTNLTLSVLHPDLDPAPRRRARRDNENNNSVVLRADYGAVRYLLPGDCELECWDDLFRNHRGDLRSDVLKAAHSNGTNSGVLVNVRPKTFVISCGRGNDYGHPAPATLRLLEKYGAPVLRTDEQGAIRCTGPVCGPL